LKNARRLLVWSTIMTDFIGGSKDSPTAAAVGESVDNSIPGIIIEAEESSQNSNTLPPLPHSLVDRVDALYPRTAVPDWYMDDAENDGRQWYLGDASANTTSSVARGGGEHIHFSNIGDDEAPVASIESNVDNDILTDFLEREARSSTVLNLGGFNSPHHVDSHKVLGSSLWPLEVDSDLNCSNELASPFSAYTPTQRQANHRKVSSPLIKTRGDNSCLTRSLFYRSS